MFFVYFFTLLLQSAYIYVYNNPSLLILKKKFSIRLPEVRRGYRKKAERIKASE